MSRIKYYIIPIVCCIASVFLIVNFQKSTINNKGGIVQSIFNDTVKIKIDEDVSIEIDELQNILQQCEILNADLNSTKFKNETILNFYFNRDESFTISFYFSKEGESFVLYRIEGLPELEKLMTCISKDTV